MKLKYFFYFSLLKALRAGFKAQAPFQVSGFKLKNPFKSFKSLIGYAELKVHSTPLALWRGVGGEAFISIVNQSDRR